MGRRKLETVCFLEEEYSVGRPLNEDQILVESWSGVNRNLSQKQLQQQEKDDLEGHSYYIEPTGSFRIGTPTSCIPQRSSESNCARAEFLRKSSAKPKAGYCSESVEAPYSKTF